MTSVDLPLDLELKKFDLFLFSLTVVSSVLFAWASRQRPVSFRQIFDAQVAQQDVGAPVRQTQNVFGQRLSRREAHFVVVKHVLQVLHNLLLLKHGRRKKALFSMIKINLSCIQEHVFGKAYISTLTFH